MPEGVEIREEKDCFKVGDTRVPRAPNTKSIEEQHYVICPSSQVHSRVNYRRFFDIADLVGVNVEKNQVYQAVHEKIKRWVWEGKIQGLRIDHPDGLLDPKGYCRRVRKDFYSKYIVLEKILEQDEVIDKSWEVDGSVGYDMLNVVNSVFVNPVKESQFTKIYQEFTGNQQEPDTVLFEARRGYIQKYLRSEIQRFSKKIQAIDKGLTLEETQTELVEFLTHFPVYRTYVQGDEVVKGIRGGSKLYTKPYRSILLKLQQIMPATFAKGFEDTFLYRYNRMVALNEVGSNPKEFGISVEKFHKLVEMRTNAYPHSMIATSTHDTKRSEDVRMRIAALTSFGDLWEEKVFEWRRLHGEFLDRDAEYLFYQTLIGIWPTTPPKKREVESLVKRLKEYMVKAMREAKIHTDWMDVNIDYERELQSFIQKVIETKHSKFWDSFYPFLQKVALVGEEKSLSLMTLKLTLPGVADFYQGNEDFRFDLVDPDNRRLVNFAQLAKFARTNTASTKFNLIKRWLHKRQSNPNLFLDGEYIPLESPPDRISYKRRHNKTEIIIDTPLSF